MARNINSVVLSGNLTRDAELKYTQGGMAILVFTLAFNDRRKNQGGEWEDKPNYIDCKILGDRAAKIQPYMAKGTKAVIQGRLQYESWDGKDGSKRSRIVALVDEVEFTTRGNGQQVAQQVTQPQLSQGASGDFFDADIPF